MDNNTNLIRDVAVLQEKIKTHDSIIEDHETRIDELEKIGQVLDKMNDNINETSEQVKQVNESVSKLKDTIQFMQQKKHEEEIRQECSIFTYIKRLFLDMSFFDWIKVIVFISAFITLIVKII